MSDVSVTIEYFAQARAAAGDQSRETIALPHRTTIADLVREIARKHGERMAALLLAPGKDMSPSVIVAVDGVQVSPGASC